MWVSVKFWELNWESDATVGIIEKKQDGRIQDGCQFSGVTLRLSPTTITVNIGEVGRAKYAISEYSCLMDQNFPQSRMASPSD